MEKQEIIEIFSQFLNENGMFYQFKEFIESQGYSLAEMGLTED